MDRKSVADAVAKAWDDMDVNMMSSLVSDDFRLYSIAVKKPFASGREAYIGYLQSFFDYLKRDGRKCDTETICPEGHMPAVRVKTVDYCPQNPLVMILDINDEGKISKILMRPSYMVSLHDLNDNSRFNNIVGNVTRRIHSWVAECLKNLGGIGHDSYWLQLLPDFNAPAFQHIAFRVGNAVYSVIINLYGQFNTCEEGYVVALGNVRKENQLRNCEEYDLVACELSIDVNALCEPRLVYAGTDEEVDFIKESSRREGALMSEWEINALGISAVLKYLDKLGAYDISYTNVLSFFPQVFYTLGDRNYYVWVAAHPAGTDEINPINIDLCELQTRNREITGMFANVTFRNAPNAGNGDIDDRVLHRGPIVTDFKGLITIEEAIDRYGSVRNGAYERK